MSAGRARSLILLVDLLRGGHEKLERRPVPTLKEFRSEFLTHVHAEMSETPKSIAFYTYCYDSLLRYEPLESARLDSIDEQLTQRFTVWLLARPCDRAAKAKNALNDPHTESLSLTLVNSCGISRTTLWDSCGL